MVAVLSKNRLQSEVGGTYEYNRLQTHLLVSLRGEQIADTPGDSLRELLRVLIVDVHRAATDTMSMQVTKWGHDVRRAYDGTTGLELVAAYQPNVVLLDIIMSGMSGLELARQVRQQVRLDDCLIIGITGRADEQRRRQCEESDIDLVLMKPVDPQILETLLMLELERVRSRQAAAPYRVLSTALRLMKSNYLGR
jgi:CheY-like chemotaxis protein